MLRASSDCTRGAADCVHQAAEEDRPRQRLGVGANVCWSTDVVMDKQADGGSFYILTAVDQFTRECVWLEADRSMTGLKVVHAQEQVRAERGSLPKSEEHHSG